MLPFTDPVLIFGSVMALILVVPLFARRLHLPEIIGLIAAGIVFGPHGLGILARDQTVHLLGTVGLLYIMFLAGLEIDLHQVRKNRSHAIVFGLLTFSIPLAMGIPMGIWVLGLTVPSAILLASMFSSHTLLTFPVVGKLGLAKSRSVTTVIGGTIITDTLALLLLSVIASTTRGEVTAGFWVRLFVLMVVYIAAVLTLIPLIGRKFFRDIAVDENSEFIFVLAVALLSSYLAHVAGLEPIIGAFLAGIALNSLIPEKSLLMTRIHFTGDIIFIPFFLLSVGMLVDLGLLLTGSGAWIISISMTVVALLAKWAAARAGETALRYRRDEGRLIFGLSVNQAAATLAAVMVGYDLGLFSEAVITGTIMMIAVTCLVGSIVTERAGRAVALHEEQAGFDASSAPHRIMIPLEERKGARELLDVALLLREKGSHEPLYPVRVAEEGRDSDQQVAAAEKILAHTVVRTMAAGIPVTPLTSVDISVTSGILRTIRDNRISMVLLNWDGQVGFKTRTFGRIIDAVVEQSVQFILVSRFRKPVSTTGRIVLVLPPLAERQGGFESVITAVKTLANQAGTTLLVRCSVETKAAAEAFVTKTPPSVSTSIRTFGAWKTVQGDLADEIDPNDWLILMSVRKGEVAWQPILDRLPGHLAGQFPNTTFSVVIPPTQRWDSQQAADRILDSSYIFSTFTRERTRLQMDVTSTEQAIRELLSCHFREGSDEARAITRLLHTMSQQEPVELTKDVVLLHAHVPQVFGSTVFLGVSRSRLDVPLASGEPHILIILLDPVGQDPARHLRALADIARIIRLPDMVQVLRTAKDFDSLVSDIALRTIGKR
ncbi:MAG: cation:proton antiporter [Sedimentisphaerales bacterium]|jgi:Kef-type K+ transport system membrane component KefB/mannitol/fructose-specific phosphotransferase system IIA component (Ntr-type)|nr:cation:proton antiporter [Sedimentisphaerales bacterium]HNY77352.1 cation:proton antiporter [Sedimentisphaerales bacterium]HOC62045.1 cation:proton antiporter [Sedimentisphaerales bacterium]HOH63568.1 cation:proton antiporter [Sedimentisphaerales bacterium]HPY48528.1 cation:proton antiporter [Sedimentisphaerales bacterium]